MSRSRPSTPARASCASPTGRTRCTCAPSPGASTSGCATSSPPDASGRAPAQSVDRLPEQLRQALAAAALEGLDRVPVVPNPAALVFDVRPLLLELVTQRLVLEAQQLGAGLGRPLQARQAFDLCQRPLSRRAWRQPPQQRDEVGGVRERPV